MSDSSDSRRLRVASRREVLEGIRAFRERVGDPGPVPAPQAVFHWTRDHQIQTLVRASDAEPDLGFLVRLLALCTLPRTDPGRRTHYVRRNGPYSLVVTAGGVDPRLPFGILPRLLLAWICTEAVRTQSRELVLGPSLAEFMRVLGVQSSDSGGRLGVRTRLREQMRRLFRASIEVIEDFGEGEHTVADRITTETHLWWSPRRTEDPVGWRSTIRLGSDFFSEIIAAPVPIDLNVLRALKRSSLGVDLYLWLTYRLFALDRPMKLTWPQLYRQFGPDPLRSGADAIKNFRAKAIRELDKIRIAWPAFDYGLPHGCLQLRPTPPRIGPAPQISTDQV